MNSFKFLLYRYKFLILYTFFGFGSLCIELIVVRALQSFHIWYPAVALIGFIAGLLTAFILNVRFNFHVAPPKRERALLYFTLISFVSFCCQLFLRQELINRGMSVDLSRFVIAGAFFLVSYFLHRRISFKENKKVGVAVYADGVEDIKKIYEKISDVCDFIHVDIVDKTFKPDCHDVKAYRAEVLRAYWQKKTIEVHIMSRTPSVWLPDLLAYVDIIYIHLAIDEEINEVFAAIRAGGCKPGIAISMKDNIEDIYPYIPSISNVLLLAISKPGFSGQKFDMDALRMIECLDKHKNRTDFTICVDGGVNGDTIRYLNVEAVVSGSFVLSSPDPIKNIMYLQTSGEYEKY